MASKKTGSTKQVNWRIMRAADEYLIDSLRMYADARRISRNTAITEAVIMLLESKNVTKKIK